MNFTDSDLENPENHGFQQGQIRGIKRFLHAEESRKTRRFHDGSRLCFGGPGKGFSHKNVYGVTIRGGWLVG